MTDRLLPTEAQMVTTLIKAGWRRSSRTFQADKHSKQQHTIRYHRPGSTGNGIGFSLAAAYRQHMRTFSEMVKTMAGRYKVDIVLPIQGEQAGYLEDAIFEGAFDDECCCEGDETCERCA